MWGGARARGVCEERLELRVSVSSVLNCAKAALAHTAGPQSAEYLKNVPKTHNLKY